MTKNNNPIAAAIENVDVTKIYECLEPAKLPFEDIEMGTPAKYNYDNVIAENIDLKDVLALNLFSTINAMNDKIINGRIKDKDAEKIRIDYLKTYINAYNCFINLVKNTNAKTIYDKEILKNFADIDLTKN